jgi:hypothetical protein
MTAHAIAIPDVVITLRGQRLAVPLIRFGFCTLARYRGGDTAAASSSSRRHYHRCRDETLRGRRTIRLLLGGELRRLGCRLLRERDLAFTFSLLRLAQSCE